MNSQIIASLVTVITLSSIVLNPSLSKADTLLCKPTELGCSNSISSRLEPNFYDLVKGSGPEVFMIQDGKRRWITDSTTFSDYGFNYDAVKPIMDSDLNSYSSGTPISKNGTLLRDSNWKIYIILDGTRRWVSPIIFDKYQFRLQDVNFVSDSNLLSIPEGTAFQ